LFLPKLILTKSYRLVTNEGEKREEEGGEHKGEKEKEGKIGSLSLSVFVKPSLLNTHAEKGERRGDPKRRGGKKGKLLVSNIFPNPWHVLSRDFRDGEKKKGKKKKREREKKRMNVRSFFSFVISTDIKEKGMGDLRKGG